MMKIDNRWVLGAALGALFGGLTVAQSKPSQPDAATPRPPAAVVPSPASGELDRELVLDANELTSVYREAMGSLQKHLEQSTLEKRYSDLSTLLEQPDLDGPALLEGLRGLKTELDRFVSGLPEVRSKLWNGVGDLGDRVHSFRQVLADDADRQSDAQVRAAIVSDEYLRDLADQILATPKGQERELLEQRFEAIVMLNERVANIRPELKGADQAILRNILRFLQSIRSHLEIAAFRTTEITVAMKSQQKMVDQFVVLIENLQATDRLADTITELANTSAPSFGQLTEQMSKMTQSLLDYTDNLNQKAKDATAQLAERAQAGGPAGGAALNDRDLQRRIREASSLGRKERSTTDSGADSSKPVKRIETRKKENPPR